MNIQQLARQYADLFIKGERTNGDKYLFIENIDKTPELRDLIYKAHEGIMPDDYKYQFIHEALEAIAECDDEIEDIYMEADIYNYDLLKWVSSHSLRQHYCDEILGAQGDSNRLSFMAIITEAQQSEKQVVLYAVLNGLKSIISTLYPDICDNCGEYVGEGIELCESCQEGSQ